MKKIIKTIDFKGLLIIVLTLIIAFLCTCTYLNSPLSSTIPWNDSSGFLYDGKSLLDGKTMYVDFFDHKGPLIFTINALGLLIGGFAGVWLLDFISVFIFLLFSCKTVKLFSNQIVAIISIGLLGMFMPYYLDIGNYTESFSLGFIGISLYLFSKYFFGKENKINKVSSIILGISLMGCLLLRPNIAVLWIIFCPVIFFHLIYKHKTRDAINFFLYCLFGSFLMFIPFAIYFTLNDAWGEFIYQFILLNFVYIDSGSSGGFFTPKVLESLKFFLKTPLLFISLLPILLLFFPKTFKKNYGKNWIYFISIYVTLLFTYLSIIISAFQFPHYGIILLPCFIICIGFFIKTIWHFINDKAVNAKYDFVKGVVIILLIVIGFFIGMYDNNTYYHLKRSTWVIKNGDCRPEITELAKFINENTEKNDGILIFGSLPELYLLSDRMSSSKYSYQNFWTFSEQSKINNQFINDVAGDKTKVLVLVDKVAYETFTDISLKVQKILDYKYELALSKYGIDIYLRK